MPRRPATRTTRSAPPPRPADRYRRLVQGLLYVAAFTLVAESLFGSRGLPALLQARRDQAEISQSLQRLKAENDRLREEAARLSSDPATIEELAREELRMLAPGEMLFILRDAKPPAQ